MMAGNDFTIRVIVDFLLFFFAVLLSSLCPLFEGHADLYGSVIMASYELFFHPFLLFYESVLHMTGNKKMGTVKGRIISRVIDDILLFSFSLSCMCPLFEGHAVFFFKTLLFIISEIMN